jgi:hypothetical protein
VTNTLAYLAAASVTAKSFMTFAPGWRRRIWTRKTRRVVLLAILVDLEIFKSVLVIKAILEILDRQKSLAQMKLSLFWYFNCSQSKLQNLVDLEFLAILEKIYQYEKICLILETQILIVLDNYTATAIISGKTIKLARFITNKNISA